MNHIDVHVVTGSCSLAHRLIHVDGGGLSDVGQGGVGHGEQLDANILVTEVSHTPLGLFNSLAGVPEVVHGSVREHLPQSSASFKLDLPQRLVEEHDNLGPKTVATRDGATRNSPFSECHPLRYDTSTATCRGARCSPAKHCGQGETLAAPFQMLSLEVRQEDE